ncbi:MULTISPECIES: helix-turn-helix transcriptional regulator [Bifidobacterium]|uniref:helix-turn-helix transcriptional regulator n=1 Tax=Bifidobacterium TaxID=1678 RepID=UPI0012DC4B21|nr:hypothetical protein [Bifidobacterium sp. 7101]
MSAKELLTPQELSALTGLSVRTLADRRYRGLPPAYLKPANSRIVLYRQTDVVTWINPTAKDNNDEK